MNMIQGLTFVEYDESKVVYKVFNFHEVNF